MVFSDFLFLNFGEQKVVKVSRTEITFVKYSPVSDSTKIRFGQSRVFVFFTKSTTSALPTISTCWRYMAAFIVSAEQIGSLLRPLHAEPNPSLLVSLVNFIKGGSKKIVFLFFFFTVVG